MSNNKILNTVIRDEIISKAQELYLDNRPIHDTKKKTVFIGKSREYNHWIKVDRFGRDLINVSHIFGSSDKPIEYSTMNTFRYPTSLKIDQVIESVVSSAYQKIFNLDDNIREDSIPDVFKFSRQVK